ncbi:ankyrin-3-like [Copidosoma floridanum]|uniref:ankyrin-3-like n=1 Tax=Copidosoma floridanum TaxID=29053 RepID=UPI0006C98FFF|nr:ankyrin-3-like [Copidosoma floridanum]
MCGYEGGTLMEKEKVSEGLQRYGTSLVTHVGSGITITCERFCYTTVFVVCFFIMSSSNAINTNNANKNYLKLAQLHNSSHEFYLDDMKMFLNKDFDINYALSFDSQVQHEKAQKWLGYTALHFAVDIKAKDHKSIINLLLKHGADFTRKNNEGLTPLHLLLKKYLTTSAVHRDSCKTLFNPLLFAHVNFNNVTNPCCRNEISHLHIAIIADNLQVTKFFLDAGISVNETISVDSSSFPGYSCLHLAMANENKEMVKMLLKYNADPVCLNSDGLSPLHLVIKKHLTDVTLIGCRKKQESKLFNNENIMDLLIESLKKKNCLPRFMGLTELHVYCAKYQTCKPEILQKMLDQNIDLNASVNDDSPIWQGYTPLHFAAHCNLQTVLLLAKKGANLLAKNMNGITPLDICLQKYYLGNTIDILKTQDEFKSIEFNDGQNLIDVLTYFKSLDKLYKHLSVTNNVNNAIPMESPLWPGYTLLHIAVKVCSTQADGKVVQICLKHGADITIQDANKMTALHLAHHLKHKQCALEILSSHQDILTNPVDQNNISHFHVSISVPGQSELGQKFLKNGVDLNEVVKMDTFWQFIRGTISKQYAVIPKGSTLLHFAVATLCRWLVRYLLENNANPYVLDADGLTWLHRAFDNENFKWLRYTVWQKDKALESNPVAPGGLSHFHVACLCGNIKSVRALLLMTPNINEPITSDLMKCIKKLPEDVCLGDTPLHLAVKAQSQNVIEFLLKAGADQTAKNDKGLNSLQVALEMKSSKD